MHIKNAGNLIIVLINICTIMRWFVLLWIWFYWSLWCYSFRQLCATYFWSLYFWRSATIKVCKAILFVSLYYSGTLEAVQYLCNRYLQFDCQRRKAHYLSLIITPGVYDMLMYHFTPLDICDRKVYLLKAQCKKGDLK